MKLPSVDLSRYQRFVDHSVAAPYVDEVLVRASIGVEGDAFCAWNAKKFREAGKRVHFYHGFVPQVAWDLQGEAFLASVWGCGWDPQNPEWGYLWNDVERRGLTLRADLPKFANMVDFKSGDDSGIYTRKSFWDFNVGRPAWAQGRRLWVAHYGVTQPAIPVGMWDLEFHQYSEGGVVPGFRGKADLNWRIE